MKYKLQFQTYQYPFTKPLSTSHGCWEIREGIIIQLQAGNKIGWGEIAPIPWFGSETLAMALEFCQGLGKEISATDIFNIPPHLTASQFGFESALADLLTPQKLPEDQFCYTSLLPAGESALTQWQKAWNQGEHTFKWKVGVHSPELEQQWFQQLVSILPSTAKLRLDGNGGLSLEATKAWLCLTDLTPQVEFFEQPLPPQDFKTMLQLNQDYQTPLALDESVASLAKLASCYERGWGGIFVIKGAIIGSPRGLRDFCQQNHLDLVFSSVFETAIGRKAVLQLAKEFSSPHRAVGFSHAPSFNSASIPLFG